MTSLLVSFFLFFSSFNIITFWHHGIVGNVCHSLLIMYKIISEHNLNFLNFL